MSDRANMVSLLSTNPSMGRQGRVDGTRELVIPGLPYIIPYRLRHRRIEVLAVIHSASLTSAFLTKA